MFSHFLISHLYFSLYHFSLYLLYSWLYSHYSAPFITYHLSFIFYFFLFLIFKPMYILCHFPHHCLLFPYLPFTLSPFSWDSLLYSLCSFHLVLSFFLSFLLLFSHFLFYTTLLPFHFPLVLLAPFSDFFSFCPTQIFGYKYPMDINTPNSIWDVIQLRVLAVHEGHMGHYQHWRTDDSTSSCFRASYIKCGENARSCPLSFWIWASNK